MPEDENMVGGSVDGDDDDDEDDEQHLDHDAITLPGAGLQLGDHLDQVGVLLEESSQPERDVGRVHLEFEGC